MTRLPLVVTVLLAVLACGCRQPDAPLAAPQNDDPDRIEDLSSNLTNIARGDPQGKTDLADDLAVLVQEKPTAHHAVIELANRLGTVVSGTSLSSESAHQLAYQLWMTVAVRDLSERQIAALQDQVQMTLVSAGIAEDRVQPVVAQVGEVQRAVNERPRRWYQLF